MKNNLDIAIECAFFVCGSPTNICEYTHTWCEPKECKRIKIAKMAIDMILKGEY